MNSFNPLHITSVKSWSTSIVMTLGHMFIITENKHIQCLLSARHLVLSTDKSFPPDNDLT